VGFTPREGSTPSSGTTFVRQVKVIREATRLGLDPSARFWLYAILDLRPILALHISPSRSTCRQQSQRCGVDAVVNSGSSCRCSRERRCALSASSSLLVPRTLSHRGNQRPAVLPTLGQGFTWRHRPRDGRNRSKSPSFVISVTPRSRQDAASKASFASDGFE
jgi:hypothetical protein